MKFFKLSVLIILFSCFQLAAYSNNSDAAMLQQRTVTGTVVDDAGVTIPGVNVFLQGTGTGVVTDIDGKYTINVPNAEAVLVFSFVGYTTFEQVVGNQTIINVTLKEGAQELDEVIVVGYGTMRDRKSVV